MGKETDIPALLRGDTLALRGGFHPKCDRGWCRVWLAEGCGESLLRRPEAEAFAGRIVHLALDLVQAGRGKGGEVELARQEAAQPAVRVLDAALLPRRVRVAEDNMGASGFP
jgi:hypothetical protein